TLSSSQVTFQEARKMSLGATVITFESNEVAADLEIKTGCHNQQFINQLADSIASKIKSAVVIPNVLYKPSEVKKITAPAIDPIQWDLLKPPGGMNVEAAFDMTTGSEQAITAVIDT